MMEVSGSTQLPIAPRVICLFIGLERTVLSKASLIQMMAYSDYQLR